MTDAVLVNRPVVAKAPRQASLTAFAATLGVFGLVIFFWLSAARAAQEEQGSTLPPLAATSAPAPAPLAVTSQVPPTAHQPMAPIIPNSGPVTLIASRPSYVPAPTTGFAPAPPVDPMRERARAPTLVVDLAQSDVPRQPGSPNVVRGDSGAEVRDQPGPAADRNLSDTERFSARVGGEEVEVAQARRMTGLDRLVPQGAVVGAVMETALNSDLPGFARAVVQRDVYSFDGTAVLIPAGSRLIGQYKSGIAQGASRVFVLWTRLIRPDGVSIELASPATDDLGRGGIGGKVNRHFLQRFGGAILTSVLSGGLTAAAASLSGGATVLVGSAGQASTLASQASQNNDIPPTITTRQGARVRVFVARDLDFSRVGPVR